MALGAMTNDKEHLSNPGPMGLARLSFAGDGAYPTGGTAGFQALVRTLLKKPGLEVIDVISGDCGDNLVHYDKANDKLKQRVISTGAEAANASNQSGVTLRCTVLYK